MVERSKRRFVVESSRLSRSSARSILRLIRSPSTWPRWQSEILSVEGPDELGTGDEVEGRAKLAGFDVHGKSVIVHVGPDLVEEEVVVGVRMNVLYRVEETNNGTVVTRRMEADLPGGIGGRLLSLLLVPRLKRMQEEVLDRLTQSPDSV